MSTKLDDLYGSANETPEIAAKIRASEPADKERRMQQEAEAKEKYELARQAYIAQQRKITARNDLDALITNTKIVAFINWTDLSLDEAIRDLWVAAEKIPQHCRRDASLVILDDEELAVEYDEPLRLASVTIEQNLCIKRLCAEADHPGEPCRCSQLPPL